MGAHLVRMRRGTRSKLYGTLRKYEPGAFAVSVLRSCKSDDEAYAEEQRLIGLLKPQYNLTDGGKGTFGRKMEKWQRDKMSREMLGVKRGPQGMTPRKWAAVWANAEKQKARGPTEAQIAAKKRNAILSGEKSRRETWCVETGERFRSMKDAARHFGPKSAIGAEIHYAMDDIGRTYRGRHFVSTEDKMWQFRRRLGVQLDLFVVSNVA